MKKAGRAANIRAIQLAAPLGRARRYLILSLKPQIQLPRKFVPSPIERLNSRQFKTRCARCYDAPEIRAAAYESAIPYERCCRFRVMEPLSIRIREARNQVTGNALERGFTRRDLTLLFTP